VKFKVGKLYKVVFWDHSCGMKYLPKCQVVGWCIDDNKNRVLLSHWLIIDSDEELVDNNLEYTCIAKDVIISKKAIG